MQSWKALIDKGAEKCGSQNKLAEAIGTTSAHIATAKKGDRPLTAAQIEALAQILSLHPHDVWMAQQAHRSPFARAAASCAGMILAAILSSSPSTSEAAIQQVANQTNDNLTGQTLSELLARLVRAWRALIRGATTMVAAA